MGGGGMGVDILGLRREKRAHCQGREVDEREGYDICDGRHIQFDARISRDKIKILWWNEIKYRRR
jgi:hypothetical protein